MIESCPQKRMLLGIILLGILTFVVLFVESHWTDASAFEKKRHFPIEQNSTCWLKGKYEIIRDCEPCSDFEIASQTIGVCIHTHYKEVLRCANGETVTRSCDRTAYVDETNFWKFEGCMLFLSLISTGCVIARKKVLYKRMIQRVQRQLANSV